MKILRAMSAEAKLGALALLTALALVSPSITGHTSQTIVNPYKARVVIHNDSGVAIHYMLCGTDFSLSPDCQHFRETGSFLLP